MTIRLTKLVNRWCCIFMLALSAAASPAWAQVDGTAPAGQSDQITLNLQDVDIRVLINTVAEVTGRNFVVDPRVKVWVLPRKVNALRRKTKQILVFLHLRLLAVFQIIQTVATTRSSHITWERSA